MVVDLLRRLLGHSPWVQGYVRVYPYLNVLELFKLSLFVTETSFHPSLNRVSPYICEELFASRINRVAFS